MKLDKLVKIAAEHKIPSLVKSGETGFYAVYNSRSRSVEHDWAHVKPFNRAAGSMDMRRVRSGQRLMCKVRKVPRM